MMGEDLEEEDSFGHRYIANDEPAAPQHGSKSRNGSDVGSAGSGQSSSRTPANASTSTSAGGLPSHLPQRPTRVTDGSTATNAKSTTVENETDKGAAASYPECLGCAQSRPFRKNTLICVLNADMSQKEVSQLPEDGLCDLSFYQAIEKEHAIVSGPGGPFNESLDLIARAAATHTKTEYGVSFDFTSMKVTRELLSLDVARTSLGDLWKKRIYHYAFLSLTFFDLSMHSYRKVFLLPQGKGMHRPWRNVYGHIMFNDHGTGQVLPPSFWNSTRITKHNVYQYNLDTAHWALGKLPKEKLGYTRFFLSMTVGARYYTPAKDAKYEILAATYFSDNEPPYIDIGR
ncbi:hypothetical protein MTO96_051981, partial [Rhipicephalus appendiculatus]